MPGASAPLFVQQRSAELLRAQPVSTLHLLLCVFQSLLAWPPGGCLNDFQQTDSLSANRLELLVYCCQSGDNFRLVCRFLMDNASRFPQHSSEFEIAVYHIQQLCQKLLRLGSCRPCADFLPDDSPKTRYILDGRDARCEDVLGLGCVQAFFS